MVSPNLAPFWVKGRMFWLTNFIAQDKGYLVNIFLYLFKNICCGYSLEAPRWGASNEYPQHMILWRNRRNTSCFFFCFFLSRKKKASYLELFNNKLKMPSWFKLYYKSLIRSKFWIIWDHLFTVIGVNIVRQINYNLKKKKYVEIS